MFPGLQPLSSAVPPLVQAAAAPEAVDALRALLDQTVLSELERIGAADTWAEWAARLAAESNAAFEAGEEDMGYMLWEKQLEAETEVGL